LRLKQRSVKKMCLSFGDGIGPYRACLFFKDHGIHKGYHWYISRPLARGCNEITKYGWMANQWIKEASFVRIRISPWDLLDYSEGNFWKVLQGKKSPVMRAHHTVYKGSYYTPNWGIHDLTVTRELIRGFAGIDYRMRTAWAHNSRQFGEYCYSCRDGWLGMRVIRYSVI
jgi:hypothetical protein